MTILQNHIKQSLNDVVFWLNVQFTLLNFKLINVSLFMCEFKIQNLNFKETYIIIFKLDTLFSH